MDIIIYEALKKIKQMKESKYYKQKLSLKKLKQKSKISCNKLKMSCPKSKTFNNNNNNNNNNIINECKKHFEKKDNIKYWSNLSINKKTDIDLI